MKKFIQILFLVFILFLGITDNTQASSDINLTIRDGNIIIFSGVVPLQVAGNINLNDIDGSPHSINAQSVLSVLNDADILSPDFNISNLTYYSSFGSLYLKCITDSTGEQCDNWQYAVNDSYPSSGMDQNILSGGENVYIYFGPQHKLLLSSNSINTSDTLTTTAQDYDYQNNSWIDRTGVTVGLTQPDPNNPWSPIEVKTSPVDINGVASFSEIPIGSYNIGIQQDFYLPTESLTITAPPEPEHHSSYSSGSIVISNKIKPAFDIKKAFNFLSSQQKENGSFGEDIYTDWSAIAFASNSENQEQKEKLKKYFSENKTNGDLLTDYERHSMALMALGLNPYNINNENYIDKITKNFDDTQFGDKNEDNDDIFALIVLQNAGFTQDEKIISDDISFILNKQKADGSWDESTDITGAGIEALSLYKEKEEIKNALEKAKEYLKQNQKDTGGWENVSSTSWAIQGILGLNEKIEDWKKPALIIGENENTPIDYLATNQDVDGGMKNENIKNKIWETAYVTTSLSDKTWNQIMQKFDKPKTEVNFKENKIPARNDFNITDVGGNTPHQTEFIKKIVKFTKPINKKAEESIKINGNQTKDPTLEIPKKENWFKKLIKKIFSIF